MFRFTLAITLASLAPLAALAQSDLSAPRIGTVLSSDGYLRDIQGVPGACRFIPDPDTTQYGTFQAASHGVSTLAATADSVVINGYGTRRFSLPGQPRAIALSPTGVFFAAAAGNALTVYSLNNPDILPKATQLADLGIADGQISLAVNDKGVALVSDATHVALAGLASTPGQQAPVALSFIRFVPNSDLAIAFSSGDATLALVHSESLATEHLLAATDGFVAPTGIELSKDGSTAWISESGSNSVMSYSLDARSAATFDLGSQGALRSIGLPGVFLWNDNALLDAQRSAPQVLLIATTEVSN
jgi:hypothetical protein